jgi:hypothetical protein
MPTTLREYTGTYRTISNIPCTHRTKPDVNLTGGVTFSPNSSRELETGAWKAEIMHAETNHTFASAKPFPGHTLNDNAFQVDETDTSS